jgi:ribosomal protein S18 acetylase RimI-like enzyme
MNLTLRPFEDADIPLMTEWLNKEYIRKWYSDPADWLHELHARGGEFSFLHHFIVLHDGEAIGFCQYYDCADANHMEDWYEVTTRGETYTIDYLIGDERYLGHGYGKEIVRMMTEIIANLGGREIIVDPELDNLLSCGVLKANGYVYDEDMKYFVKRFSKNIVIRPLENNEIPILEDFLYLAVFVPEGHAPVPRDVIYHPNVYAYIEAFGGKDDRCLVAEKGSKIVGAAWSRIMAHPGKRGYGNIDAYTPELAISVLPEYRGKGIGTRLLTALFDLLKENGYSRLSLSVQKDNPALRLYQRTGFIIAGENDEDYIMVKNL